MTPELTDIGRGRGWGVVLTSPKLDKVDDLATQVLNDVMDRRSKQDAIDAPAERANVERRVLERVLHGLEDYLKKK